MRALVLVLFAAAMARGADPAFSAEDRLALERRLRAAQGADGLFGSPQDDLHGALAFGGHTRLVAAISALSALGVDSHAACPALLKALSAATGAAAVRPLLASHAADASSVSDIAAAAEIARCGELSLSAAQRSALQQAIAGGDLPLLHKAASAVLLLGASKRLNIADFDFARAVQTVAGLALEDGSFAVR
jgi:hypothetical protein